MLLEAELVALIVPCHYTGFVILYTVSYITQFLLQLWNGAQLRFCAQCFFFLGVKQGYRVS